MVRLEKTPYGGWDNCLRLSGGGLDFVVTVDVGPRVIRLCVPGRQNLLKEFDDQMGKTSGTEWMSFGGHRLWHAPEVFPRCPGRKPHPSEAHFRASRHYGEW